MQCDTSFTDEVQFTFDNVVLRNWRTLNLKIKSKKKTKNIKGQSTYSVLLLILLAFIIYHRPTTDWMNYFNNVV